MRPRCASRRGTPGCTSPGSGRGAPRPPRRRGGAAARGRPPVAPALRERSWPSRLYVAWQRALLPAVARRAVHLVTVSQFSRDELVQTLHADPERITVIPGGVDERFEPGAEPPSRERPYVLTVASRTARKNLGALSETAARLARDGV